jgi:chromosome segregation ATPase
MEMNESSQHMLMTAIQEFMSKDRTKRSASVLSLSLNADVWDNDTNLQLRKALADLARITEQKENITQKYNRLDQQVLVLQDDKLSLMNEIEMLKDKLQREDNVRTDSSFEMEKYLKLQSKHDIMQEEMFKLESDKEKYRMQFEAIKSEHEMLLEKNIELKKMAQDSQNLRDEIDILKHQSERAQVLETSIETYKIKLEEMADYRKQMKQLEDNNSKYFEKIIQLEDEIKKITMLKGQIDNYKRQIQQLHEESSKDEMKIKKLEYECKDKDEVNFNLKQEKERLQSENERMKEERDLLELSMAVTQTQNESSSITTNNQNSMSDSYLSSAELLNVPGETKEKIQRLYHENKLLKSKQNDYTNDRLAQIQTQYDDLLQRNEILQTKMNNLNTTNIELECNLNNLIKNNYNKENKISEDSNVSSDKNNETINDYKKQLNDLKFTFDLENNKKEIMIKQLESKVNSLCKSFFFTFFPSKN